MLHNPACNANGSALAVNRQHMQGRAKKLRCCCRAESTGQDPLLVRVARGEGEFRHVFKAHIKLQLQICMVLTDILFLCQLLSEHLSGLCVKQDATWQSSASAPHPLILPHSAEHQHTVLIQCSKTFARGLCTGTLTGLASGSGPKPRRLRLSCRCSPGGRFDQTASLCSVISSRRCPRSALSSTWCAARGLSLPRQCAGTPRNPARPCAAR